jgi:hypothetical protein
VAFNLVILALAGFFALWWFALDDTESTELLADSATSTQETQNSDVTTESSPTQSPTTTTTTPTPATPGPTTPSATEGTPSQLPFTPKSALQLSTGEATRTLNAWVVRDRPKTVGLAGSWVPQTSSKCAGLEVDLKPKFTPDGVPETSSVSVQQILAFHAALEDRYNAITTTGDELGIDPPSSGGCAGKPIWVSLVPRQYGTGESANKWCDDQLIPIDECAARRVVPPSESGTALLLR